MPNRFKDLVFWIAYERCGKNSKVMRHQAVARVPSSPRVRWSCGVDEHGRVYSAR